MTTNELLKQGVPFLAARDYLTVKWWLDNNKKVDPNWIKRYEDIKSKYGLD